MAPNAVCLVLIKNDNRWFKDDYHNYLIGTVIDDNLLVSPLLSNKPHSNETQFQIST